jgi:hypothetical protein
MKSADVPIFNYFSGSRDNSFASMSTATLLNKAKAIVIPSSTSMREVSAAIVIAISRVLSPSSATSISKNVEMKGKASMNKEFSTLL